MIKIMNRFTEVEICDGESVLLATQQHKRYLSDANLRGASLSDADLSDANLSDANLRGANLRGANLSYANLRGANLLGADLRDANLRGANLSDANLRGANLRGANLSDANLRGANLSGDDLRGADLRGADLLGARLPNFSCCPELGAFIAFKKLRASRIATLEIPAEAKRTSSLVGRKCRAEFALVKSIESVSGDEQFTDGLATHDGTTKYTVGSIVKPDSFDDDIRVECTHGIHFFITRREAVEY